MRKYKRHSQTITQNSEIATQNALANSMALTTTTMWDNVNIKYIN